MLVKINKKSKGRTGAVEYLLDARVEEGTAVLLRGNEEYTKHLIKGIDRVHKYLSGGLMFDKTDAPTEAQENAIMDSFEKMACIALDKCQVNLLWSRHVDKDRVELNFLFARVDLSSGKDLDLYTHKRDKYLFKMWQNGINKHFSFANPDAEDRKRTPSERAKAQSKGNFETSFISKRADLDEKLQELVSTGVLTSKADIFKLLKLEGFEITRNSKNSISVKAGILGKKALRLNNRPIYEDRFKSLADLKPESAAKVIVEQIQFKESVYDKYLKRRSDRHFKRYGLKKKTARSDLNSLKKVTQLIVSDKKENYDTSRETARKSEERDREERQDNRGAAGSVQERVAELVSDSFRIDQDRSKDASIKCYEDGVDDMAETFAKLGGAIDEFNIEQETAEQRGYEEGLFGYIREWIGENLSRLGGAIERIREGVRNRPKMSEEDRLIDELKGRNKRVRGELRELGSVRKRQF